MQKYKTLEEFYSDQPEDKASQIKLIREYILDVEPSLEETLKWNALNFVYKGEDRITFNLMNKQNQVKIILHMGAKRKENKKGNPIIEDATGIVEWNSDIRGTVPFNDLTDVKSKQASVKQILRNWLDTN